MMSPPTAHTASTDRPRRSAASWLWIVVAVIIGFGKTEGVRLLDHHIWGWVIILGVMSAWLLLRSRLVLCALFAAAAIACLLGLRPVGVAIASGCVLFAGLLGLFVLIGTLLRHADDRA